MDATDATGELRQNVLTGHWVAVAPTRGRRPSEHRPPDPGGSEQGGCPFCPGNEAELPEILAETRGNGGGAPFATRVVPNRYPAFTNDPARGEWVEMALADADSGIGRSLTLGSDVPVVLADPVSSVGYQEVIIESPRHDRDLADMEPDELRTVVDTYHQRYLSVSESAPSCRVFLFRNRGRSAGTSLSHPHAQLIATTVIPPEVRVREIRMLGYHGDHGRCLVCSLPDIEPGWDERLVTENDAFTAVVPWAAEVPFEVWIIPRNHQAEFGEAVPAERAALAEILGRVLRSLRTRAGDPPYNLMIHSPRRSRSGSRAFHWLVQVRPRSGQMAGFELSSGIMINSSSPVADARRLAGRAGTGAPTA